MGKLKDKYGGIVMGQKIIVIYLVLIVCLISGCGPKVGNENGKGESDNNSEIEMSDNTKSTDFNISYGIEEVKQNDFRLEYNGEPVSLHSFVNCSTDIKIGIYLFADGRIQSYEDCSTKEEGINHIYDVKAGEKKINEIKFVPDIGNEGDDLSLRFLFVINPDTVPDKESFVYAHDTNMNQVYPINIHMNVESNNKSNIEKNIILCKEMTQEEYDSKVYDKYGKYRNMLDTADFVMKNNNNEEVQNYIKTDGGVLNFVIEGCGGNNDYYNITAYVNGVVLEKDIFNAIFQIQGGRYITKKEFDVDLTKLDKNKYKLDEYNSLFFVAVPESGNKKNLSQRIRVCTFGYK